MFTNRRLEPYQLTGNWSEDGPRLLRVLNEFMQSLEVPRALAITEASINGSPVGNEDPDTGAFTTISASGLISANGGQVQFPATQNASTDVNTLDDYKEVSAQNITVTSGSGSFTSVSGTIDCTKVGREILWQAVISITTNGTAATDIRFTFPFTVSGIAPFSGFETASGFGLTGYINGASAIVYKYDSTYPGADGRTLRLRGVARV